MRNVFSVYKNFKSSCFGFMSESVIYAFITFSLLYTVRFITYIYDLKSRKNKMRKYNRLFGETAPTYVLLTDHPCNLLIWPQIGFMC